MFYVGISVAANSLFVAVIASLAQPWEVGVVPVALTLLAVGTGVWSLWVRALPQFPDPVFLKEGEGLGIDDDEVAWAVVSAIAASCSVLNQSLRRVSRVSRALAILTAAQLLSATATGAYLVL